MDTNERRQRASREAADWWALLQGDDMTKAEREDFIDWLRDSQTNIAEMLRLSQVHGALSQFREWADISTDRPPTEGQGNVVTLPMASSPVSPAAHFRNLHPSPSPSQGEGALDQAQGRSRNASRGLRLFAFAATLAAIAVITAVLLPQFRGQWIATERGERREIVLDDGSVLQVDPQSRLNIQFDESQRRVVLEQGRAVFRVAKNPRRPFRVEAGDTTVRAIGTAFGVDRRAPDHVVVTVSEGKVAVTSPSIANAYRTLSSDASSSSRHPSASDKEELGVRTAGTREVLLGANEQITVAMPSPQLVRAVDSQRELAWAEGRLVFKNDTVANVIAEFNRYNRVQLTVTDPTLAARPVTGVFDAANPEGFLAFLQNAAPVRIERDEGRSIVISPSASR